MMRAASIIATVPDASSSAPFAIESPFTAGRMPT